jgi:hypothetical protein
VDGAGPEILYASAVSSGRTMRRASNDTDPMGSPAANALEGEKARLRPDEVTEPRPKPLPGDNQTIEDENVRSLLEGLDLSRAPAPIQAPTTNGELAASYAVAGHAPARRHETPTPQPSVMVREPTLRMGIPVMPTAAHGAAAAEARHEALRAERSALTVRVDRPPHVQTERDVPRLRPRPVLLAAAAVAATSLGIIAALAFPHGDRVTKAQPPTESAPASAAAVPAQPSQSQPPSTPPVRPSAEPVASPARSPSAGEPGNPTAVPASTPKPSPRPSASSLSSTLRKPTRSTTNLVDDEP